VCGDIVSSQDPDTKEDQSDSGGNERYRSALPTSAAMVASQEQRDRSGSREQCELQSRSEQYHRGALEAGPMA